jgi:hypothetical protein
MQLVLLKRGPRRPVIEARLAKEREIGAQLFEDPVLEALLIQAG